MIADRRLALLALALIGALMAVPAAGQPAPAELRRAFAGLQPTARPAGLLLGLADQAGFRTLYLTYSDGQVALAEDAGLIVTPQADGFWLIDRLTAAKGRGCPGSACNFQESRLWVSRDPGSHDAFEAALRTDLLSMLYGLDPAQADFRLDVELDYVAGGVVCATHSGSGYLGGAHPFTIAESGCLVLAEPVDRLDHADLARYLAAPAMRSIRQEPDLTAAAGQFEEGRMNFADRHDFGPSVGPVTFRLRREDGQTVLDAIRYYDAPYALSSTYTFTAVQPVGPAPASLTPYNPEPDVLAALRTADPSVVDAFVSPEQNVVYALYRNRLDAYAVPDGATLLSLSLGESRVVMVEWAQGSHVARWAAMLRALFPA